MFSRSFMNFEDDPFFNAHQQHMRDMDRMMGGFGGFGSPFGSPFGMLEGPQDPRGGAMMPQQDGFMTGFGSMFRNMNTMMSQMHRNFDNVPSNPNGYSFSSSKVMTYSNDGRGQPKYFEASSSTKTAPGGVKETQKSLKDSESGIQKMSVGHHIGDRAHVMEKSRSTRTEEEEQKQDFVNMDENDAHQFDREWKEKTKGFHGARGHHKISGFDDDRRRHGGESRSRAMPALEHRSHHREREGRDKHHAVREKRHAEENQQKKKEKKVRIAERESHL